MKILKHRKLLICLLGMGILAGCIMGDSGFFGTLTRAANKDFFIEDGVLIKYFGKSKQVVIPSSVKEIGECAFELNSSLEEITIPRSVKSIRTGAFMACSKLKKIKWSKGIQRIELHAFCNCTSLKKVNLPSSVNYVGARAFEGTPWMKSKKGFVIVNNMLLQYNGKKMNLTIPEGVRFISGRAFYDHFSDDESWHGPRKVILPKSLEIMGEKTFDECTELEQVVFNSNVKEIPTDAFYYCEKLRKILLPAGVSTIGEAAFYRCEALQEIELPSKLKSIGESAFTFCTFDKITFPAALQYIGRSAFEECKNLDSVTFDSSETVLDSYAFKNTPWFSEFKEDFIIINNCLMGYNGKSKKVVVPSNVRYVNSCWDEKNIKSIILPKGLKGIGSCGLGNLDRITEIKIPATVEYIGEDAFYFMERVKKITIPGSVKYIDVNAFDACEKIGHIVFSSGIEKLPEQLIHNVYCNLVTGKLNITIKGNTKIVRMHDISSGGQYPGITIFCKKDSPAHKYSKRRNIKCKFIK